ncbi:MAG: DUF6279 family lipoprotein [bacterium]|nr:DUF6279 family lipoprotein [bacterium]
MKRGQPTSLFDFQKRFAAPVWRCVAAGLLALFASGGCTSFVYKTVYNQADFLVMRELDRYFDLRSEQRSFLDRRVDQLHVWHRRKELPRYAAALREFRDRFAVGLKARDIDWLFARSNNFRDAAFRRVYDDAYVFLSSLERDQMQHLRAALRESNEEIVEKIELPRTERLAKRKQSTLEFLEDWSGGLRKDQSREVERLVEALPELDRSRLRYRRERQSEFLAKLPANGGDPDALRSALRAWLYRPEQTRPAYYQSGIADWRAAFRSMALKIDANLDANQRRAILQRFNRVIADLDDLSRR